MRNRQWAKLFSALRQRNNMTGRQVAENAGIDPSYITRIEREGLIPRRDKVEALAKALNAEAEYLLLAAGYSPLTPGNNTTPDDYIEDSPMPKELASCLRDLSQLSWEHQCKAARFISVFLTSVAARKRHD